MLSSPKFLSRVILSRKYQGSYNWWSYTTYDGKDKARLTIITVYRAYKPNGDIDVFTIHLQQWGIMEKRNIDHINIIDKMINDINKFLVELIFRHYEVIIFIDANEPCILDTKGIEKLICNILPIRFDQKELTLPFSHKS